MRRLFWIIWIWPAIAGVLMKGRQREAEGTCRQEGDKAEIGVMWPQAKECQHSLVQVKAKNGPLVQEMAQSVTLTRQEPSCHLAL